jgi:hypothetical protein
MSQAGKTRRNNEILTLHKRAEAPEAPQVHWSTYVWGTTTILFGLHTVWNQTATYLLNKEKWTAEKANLEAEKAVLEAKKAVTIIEVNRLIQARLGPIEADIRHLQKISLEHE